MNNLLNILSFVVVCGIMMPLSAQQREKLPATLEEKVMSVTFSSDVTPGGFSKGDAFAKETPTKFILKEGDANKPVYEIEVPRGSQSQYNVNMHWNTTGSVKKGDVMLASISMRTLSARQESGESVVYFYFQGKNEKSFTIQIGSVEPWKTFFIPFVAHADLAAGEAQIGLAYGTLAQHVEVSGIEILNFGQNVSLNDLPVTRFSYMGREADAQWRKDALKRIEEIRTAPLAVKVVDSKGKPVRNAKVEVRMDKSDFIWGTAVSEGVMAGNDTNSKTYKSYLKELFNTAVISNGFKAAGWAWDEKQKMNTLLAFDWLKENGFRQRGHNLVWPAWKFNSPLTKHIAMHDSASFDRYIKAQFYERMAYTKGHVIAWDVVNEYMHEKEFFHYLPADVMVDWFKLAHKLDPDAQLFINEYAMLNCIQSPQNINAYIDTIQVLRAKGAPIHAVGVQGHVGRQPRNPSQVITDLDLFLPMGLPVQITEFDINTPDEELQADYLRDFLIAVYSHPIVTGVTLWGFWQKDHWKPDAAMLRTDWSPKLCLAKWRELVTGEWKTNVTGNTDKKGCFNIRGHLGEYVITVSSNGNTIIKKSHLTKDGLEVLIEM